VSRGIKCLRLSLFLCGYFTLWGTSDPTSGPKKLTPTSQSCLRLAKTLPYLTYRLSIYFDNYFSNVTLFANLRALGIGVCGTARSSAIPEDLRVDKNTARKVFPWDHTSAVIVLWQDNNTVFIMSTIHDLNTRTLVNQRRQVLMLFLLRKSLGQKCESSLLIDDYNHYPYGSRYCRSASSMLYNSLAWYIWGIGCLSSTGSWTLLL